MPDLIRSPLTLHSTELLFRDTEVGIQTMERPVFVTANEDIKSISVAGHGSLGREFPWTPGETASLRRGQKALLGTITFSPRGYGSRSYTFVIRTTGIAVAETRLNVSGRGLPPRRMGYREVSTGAREDRAKEGRHYFLSIGRSEAWEPLFEEFVLLGLRPYYPAIPATTKQGLVDYETRPVGGEVLLESGIARTGANSMLRAFEVQRVETEWLQRHHTVVDDRATRMEVDGVLQHIFKEHLDVHNFSCLHCRRDRIDGSAPAQGQVWIDEKEDVLHIVASTPAVTSVIWESGGLRREQVVLTIRALPAEPGDEMEMAWGERVWAGTGGDIIVFCFTMTLWPLRGLRPTAEVVPGASMERILLKAAMFMGVIE